MSAPHPLAVQVCFSSPEHSSGRGRHDAVRYGPCSDHERIVAEVLAVFALNPTHVAAYVVAASNLRARIADLVKPGWHSNTGYQYDDVLTAYAAGRNDLIDAIRSILADVPRDVPLDAEQNWWDDRTMPNDDGPDWHRDADGVLWQVDPRNGHRHKVVEAERTEPGAGSGSIKPAHLGVSTEPDTAGSDNPKDT